MTKILAVIVVLSSSLLAVGFDEFLNNALKNSPHLESAKISIEQTSMQSKILTRLKNPELELEFAQFKPDEGRSDNGYRVALLQPVRLWGVGDSKSNLAQSLEEKSKANLLLNRAELIKNISLNFASYRELHELLTLAEEEKEIAIRIYEISLARYDAGRISRGEMLQAKLDLELRESAVSSLKITLQNTYYELLKSAGYTQEIAIEYKHTFTSTRGLLTQKNPSLLYTNTLHKEALAQHEVDSNVIEFINIVGEFENEPDQNIFRVGVAIPLGIFNTKDEERQIAKLEAKKLKYLAIKESKALRLAIKKLTKEKNLLTLLYAKNEKTLQTQKELLSMYEASYKIASVNLLELQNIKNQMIKTKESLIRINLVLNINAITHNFITGAYNE